MRSSWSQKLFSIKVRLFPFLKETVIRQLKNSLKNRFFTELLEFVTSPPSYFRFRGTKIVQSCFQEVFLDSVELRRLIRSLLTKPHESSASIVQNLIWFRKKRMVPYIGY